MTGISLETLALVEAEGDGLGVKNLVNLTPADQSITDMLDDVAKRMHITLPPVALHEGDAMGTAYNSNHSVLVISRKLANALEPDEFKAFISHELDHHSKIHLAQRMQRAHDKLMERPAPNRLAIQNAITKFSDFLEFAADDRAKNLYGADAMSRALQKAIIEMAVENGGIKALLFYDRPDMGLELGRNEVTQRVADMASGAIEYPKHTFDQLSRRFSRLEGRGQAQHTSLA